MDDFDDLLTGLDRFDDFLANGFGFNLFNEVFYDRQRDISFEQGNANFAHGSINILFGQRPAPRKVIKYTA